MQYITEKESNPAVLDEYTIHRIEEMKKFLVAVGKISYFMELSSVFNSWVDDAGRQARINDPVEILERTMLENKERIPAVEFVLGKKFRIDDAISEMEKKILGEAFSYLIYYKKIFLYLFFSFGCSHEPSINLDSTFDRKLLLLPSAQQAQRMPH